MTSCISFKLNFGGIKDGIYAQFLQLTNWLKFSIYAMKILNLFNLKTKFYPSKPHSTLTQNCACAATCWKSISAPTCVYIAQHQWWLLTYRYHFNIKQFSCSFIHTNATDNLPVKKLVSNSRIFFLKKITITSLLLQHHFSVLIPHRKYANGHKITTSIAIATVFRKIANIPNNGSGMAAKGWRRIEWNTGELQAEDQRVAFASFKWVVVLQGGL